MTILRRFSFSSALMGAITLRNIFNRVGHIGYCQLHFGRLEGSEGKCSSRFRSDDIFQTRGRGVVFQGFPRRNISKKATLIPTSPKRGSELTTPYTPSRWYVPQQVSYSPIVFKMFGKAYIGTFH